MITSIDTNVLFDLFRTDSPHHSRSRGWLRDAYDRGAIIVCDLVYAEVVPEFADKASLDEALREIGATLSPIDSSIAYEAGLRWKLYRGAGGPRIRIITDFLIGAHALATADSVPHTGPGVLLQLFP